MRCRKVIFESDYDDIFYERTGMGVKSCTGSFLLF